MHIKFGKRISYGGEIIDGQADGRGATLNIRSGREGIIMFDKPAKGRSHWRPRSWRRIMRKNGPSAGTVTVSPATTPEPFSQWKLADG